MGKRARLSKDAFFETPDEKRVRLAKDPVLADRLRREVEECSVKVAQRASVSNPGTVGTSYSKRVSLYYRFAEHAIGSCCHCGLCSKASAAAQNLCVAGEWLSSFLPCSRLRLPRPAQAGFSDTVGSLLSLTAPLPLG